MKPDDFEQCLSRRPLKEIPSGWRAEILAVAERASRPKPRASFLSTLNAQLSTFLWPHPRAWAGLAAVWILIFAVDFSMRDKSPMVAEKISPPSPEIIAELKKEHLMYAELIGARDTSDADRSKLRVPSPRSERTEMLMT
jgi:hypothetical protein